MMNLKLKNAINTAYKLCDALQNTESWDSANTATAKEIFRGELFHFLLYLSFSDGVLTKAESQFIKEYLDFDYSVNDMREYAIANNVYGGGFANSIPYCFKAFVASDNKIEKSSETGNLILNLYAQLGQEFIACDKVDNSENYSLKLYCENMRSYMDQELLKSVNLSLGSLNDADKKVSLPNVGRAVQPQTSQIACADLPQEKSKEAPSEKTIEELMAELNDLVGLSQIKQDVKDLINLVKIRSIRKERGMPSPAMSLHLVFSGNPGTGKTTIARLLSQIYKSMGLLSKGHLTEVDRSGLVGGYVGQTALKVQEVVNKAKGGVLFIDEAYSLTVNRGANDYGFEAVDTLLKYMEDNRD
ncbi:MAG: AAA family ATPase, partial [Oscillospiraceae bacterium]